MPQQRDRYGQRDANPNQYPGGERFQEDAPRYRRVEYKDNSAQLEAQDRARRKREAALRKQLRLQRKHRHQRRALIGVLILLGLVAAFILIKTLNNSFGTLSEQELDELDLEELSAELRAELKKATGQKKLRLIKRLEVVEAFRLSGNDPSWMIMDVLPVIPPEIRPMVQLDGGRFATSDLNDLYRRVINRNNRLKRLIQLSAPDIIIRNEKRMLQEAVDALIDNGRRGRAVTGANNRALKSLSDMLKGKQGRFRQNLLGKRVDYSGRSVIVVGPELKLYQCGVPKEMAVELFRPFIMKKLVEDGVANNIKSAKKMIDKGKPEVWDALEFVIKDRPVMLNRAPTLHRLGIQAFEPVLVEGRALKLHPLCCTAFNADFDGDQMAIHVPLSAEAQAEARVLMLSANNLLRPQDGQPVTVPTQDMILGTYYLTIVREDEEGTGKVFSSADEAMLAYDAKAVGLHAPIKVRMSREVDGVEKSRIIDATVGRLIFNNAIPQDLGYVDRSDPEKCMDLEVGFTVGKKQLSAIIDKCIRKHGFTISTEMLDNVKALGYKHSTLAALTVSIADMTIPEAKYTLVAEAEKEVVKIDQFYKRGDITNDERYRLTVAQWEETTNQVSDALQKNLGRFNPIYMMADSGARGSMSQIRQLAGMRGLMANTAGKTIEIPIKSNFREGLSVLEYFIASRGARKGLTDTALRTADSGYLTRRLVDVSHNVIVREFDCGTEDGVVVKAFVDEKEVLERLKDRITGRTAAEDIVNPLTGEIIAARNDEIDEEKADEIDACGIESVKIRSVMTCKSKTGVCARCYGRNLATGDQVNIGEAVGIIAAQSIGEPGTQLTMRTFHTGGVAGSDITQGLPRVEELFESRKPKGVAVICEADGVVQEINPRPDNKSDVIVKNDYVDEGEDLFKTYEVPYGARLVVQPGDRVEAGTNITAGPLNPHDIFKLKGVEGVYDYLIKECQRVYRSQGVDINDKHIEIIVSQMLSKYKVEDPGTTDLLPGGMYGITDIEEANAKAIEEEGEPCVSERLLLGITKASLATSSFLSAASFQETTKVLTDAAVKGKTDHLQGLKENVIIGKLIPAGTGMRTYRQVEVDYGENTEYMESFDKKPENHEKVRFDANRPEARFRDFADEQRVELTEEESSVIYHERSEQDDIPDDEVFSLDDEEYAAEDDSEMDDVATEEADFREIGENDDLEDAVRDDEEPDDEEITAIPEGISVVYADDDQPAAE